MKICVLSDSHGRTSLMWDILFDEKPDKIFFLGDGVSDLYEFGNIPQVSVCGNCDLCGGDEELVFPLEKETLLLTHGHKYGVKQGLYRLFLRAKETGASVVFYGHIHRQKAEEEEGIMFICPGAVKNGRYAVIKTVNGKIETELKSL
ncbi:MAG: YfcE family phosphodiesterase [Clostridia bacterium]|nr:YfcE family phosphodiesterase [Clostridia bacterium]